MNFNNFIPLHFLVVTDVCQMFVTCQILVPYKHLLLCRYLFIHWFIFNFLLWCSNFIYSYFCVITNILLSYIYILRLCVKRINLLEHIRIKVVVKWNLLISSFLQPLQLYKLSTFYCFLYLFLLPFFDFFFFIQLFNNFSKTRSFCFSQ